MSSDASVRRHAASPAPRPPAGGAGLGPAGAQPHVEPCASEKEGARGGTLGSPTSKRILVTGGAGFISSNLVRHLLEHTTHEVVSLDALTYAGNLENLADVMSHPRLAFVHGDIRDAELVREVVAGVDVIVNAAAESHVEKSILEGASEFVTTNVEGTQILLDAIRETPVERFLLISSSEVYGTAAYAPMDERHPLEPRSPYAATKAGGDRLAYSYWVTYELPIAIVRPFNNYGPRQHPEKVVPRFITQALAGESLTIHGDGHASRDWLHVDDTASAIEALVDAPIERIAGEVLNVATGVDIPVAEIARLVLEAVGNPEATTVNVEERPGQVDRHIGSTDAMERLTGWRSSIAFEDGLERTVAWYRENEAWWRGVLGRVGVSSS